MAVVRPDRGGACRELANDHDNCGACGNACAADQVCDRSRCLAGCGTRGRGETTCNGACVNTRGDPQNCGGCGITCPAGYTCQRSACTCATGRIACAGNCVEPLNDPGNCGMCGLACPGNQVCAGGTCACPGGKRSAAGFAPTRSPIRRIAAPAGMHAAPVDSVVEARACAAPRPTIAAGAAPMS